MAASLNCFMLASLSVASGGVIWQSSSTLSRPMLQGKMDGTSGPFQPLSGVFHPPVRSIVGA